MRLTAFDAPTDFSDRGFATPARRLLAARLCAAFLLASAAGWGQVATKANGGYKTPEDRARVAQSLASSDRDGRQRPQELVEALKIEPGSTVVDLGTGVGYMLPYLSKAVGAQGKVIAEDIFPDFLEQAKKTAKKQGLQNVSFVLGTVKAPNLPPNAADLVLALDAYHHFDYPEKMLAGIAAALKPGGRLAIVDFYKYGFRDPDHIRLDLDGVVNEIERNGFYLIYRSDHMPKTQYIAIFAKR